VQTCQFVSPTGTVSHVLEAGLECLANMIMMSYVKYTSQLKESALFPQSLFEQDMKIILAPVVVYYSTLRPLVNETSPGLSIFGPYYAK
jgi:hypothetical protein